MLDTLIRGLAMALGLGALPAAAQADTLPDWLAIHGQGTFVLQGTPGFRNP